MVLTWSKKAFPKGGPQSWADFFDVAKFPGPRSLPDTGDRDWWVPLAALMADGVPRDKLFPMDVDRAYKKLDTIKKHVAAWWKSGDNSMQILRGGDAVMSMLYSSRAVPLAKSGEFDFTWNGAIRDTGNWAVLKGGPNTANAIKFLDFFVQDPSEHLPFSDEVSFDSNNKRGARPGAGRGAALPAELSRELRQAGHRRLCVDRRRSRQAARALGQLADASRPPVLVTYPEAAHWPVDPLASTWSTNSAGKPRGPHGDESCRSCSTACAGPAIRTRPALRADRHRARQAMDAGPPAAPARQADRDCCATASSPPSPRRNGKSSSCAGKR